MTKQEVSTNLRLLSARAETKRRGDGLEQLCCVHSSRTEGRPTPRLNKKKTSVTYCGFTKEIPLCSTFVHKENVPLMFFDLFQPLCAALRLVPTIYSTFQTQTDTFCHSAHLHACHDHRVFEKIQEAVKNRCDLRPKGPVGIR